MLQAINDASRSIMRTHKNCIFIGEDVEFGGVFRCSQGLLSEFGTQRVIDSPISEQGLVGFGIGLANNGFKVLGEIQFADYVYPAFDQVKIKS